MIEQCQFMFQPNIQYTGRTLAKVYFLGEVQPVEGGRPAPDLQTRDVRLRAMSTLSCASPQHLVRGGPVLARELQDLSRERGEKLTLQLLYEL